MALPEKKGCRIFAGTRDVLYFPPGSRTGSSGRKFTEESLPYLKVMPDQDASYPLNFKSPFTYFLQHKDEEAAPWGAMVYSDGSGILERSTRAVKTRKIFCWGQDYFGSRRQDFSTESGQGEYLEMQSGLAPSTEYGLVMEENSSLSFTQAFGPLQVDAGDAGDPSYDISHAIVRAVLNTVLPADKLDKQEKYFHTLSALSCSKILSFGHGWGALENLRRMAENIPSQTDHLVCPPESLTEEQYPWLALLNGEPIRELSSDQVPKSWMTDISYLPYLQAYIKEYPESYTARLYTGVLLYENEFQQEAVEIWDEASRITPLPIILRNLAYSSSATGFTLEALAYMERINWSSYPNIDRAFLEEYYSLLLEDGQYQRMFRHYQNLPRRKRESEPLLILACEAAIELDEFSFLDNAFAREYATLHYTDSRMHDIWEQYVEKKELEPEELPQVLSLYIEN